MKCTDRKTGFWEPGLSIFSDELSKEESRRMADLNRRLKAATVSEERERIKKLMAEAKTEFRKRRKDAGYCLFAEK